MKVSAIVVAAGSGSRMRSDIKKPFIKVCGIPVIIRTLQAIEQSLLVKEIIVVVGEEELNELKQLVAQYGLRRIIRYAPGGKDRQDSVRNGLSAIEACDVVVVHDGVRPFVAPDEIERVIRAAADEGAATIGTPVKDTIKKVENGIVKETVPREHLFAVQTPQAFRADVLREAHMKAEAELFAGTDDAALVEWLGHPVRVVEGSYRNIKLTTPEDLIIAEAFISKA